MAAPTSTPGRAPESSPSGAGASGPRARAATVVPTVVTVVLLLALVVPRLHSGSALWLDEALSVDIARLSPADLVAALRQDGSPPLYYALLHVWMAGFGTGDVAVRALSTVFSLAALPVAYLVGRRLDGPRAGTAAALLLAASPFAIRYATETRMYALVMLLTLLGILATLRALQDPTTGRLVAVAAVSGLLTLTHYWAFFLIVVGELGLVVRAVRVRRAVGAGETVAGKRLSRAVARVAWAPPAGAVLFLPWLPTFVFQVQHTGTPWAPPPGLADGVSTVRQWAGPGWAGLGLCLLVSALALWSLRQAAGRRLVALGVGSLALGLALSRWQGAGYALRYSAPALVPVLLAAAVGAARCRVRVTQATLAAAAVLALLVVTTTSLLGSRTQAPQTAAVLKAALHPGDVVVYCPDQLGPAVSRLLPSAVDQVVYPTMGSPALVDWVDYAQRNAAASPAAFAAAVGARTTGAVWLVWSDGYRTFGTQCSELDRDLATLRGGRTVRQTPSGNETQWLVSYPAVR